MSRQKKILIPTEDIESWRSLSKPEHWREGYSAMSIAISWEKAGGVPPEMKKMLSANAEFADLELLLAIPEYKVALPGGTRPSQNDVFAVLRSEKLKSLSVMTVEGKAKEDFDRTIRKWKTDTSNEGVRERLGFILQKIGLADQGIDDLRYQLFHRLASAVIMAEQYYAKNAIMVIQSFNNNDNENHFSDFVNFMSHYDYTSVEKSKLYELKGINETIRLYAGWVFSEIKK